MHIIILFKGMSNRSSHILLMGVEAFFGGEFGSLDPKLRHVDPKPNYQVGLEKFTVQLSSEQSKKS